MNKNSTVTHSGQISPNAEHPVAPLLLKDLKRSKGKVFNKEPRLLTAAEFANLKRQILTDLKTFDGARQLPYHNRQHTEAVFRRSNQLAKIALLSKEKKQLLLIASLFHDYIHGQRKKQSPHQLSFEQKSAIEADKVLSKLGFNLEQRLIVYGLILSTTFSNPNIHPATPLEKMLVSADLGGFVNSDKKWLTESIQVTMEMPPEKRPKNFKNWLADQEFFLKYVKNRLSPETRVLRWEQKLKEKQVLLKNLRRASPDAKKHQRQIQGLSILIEPLLTT